MKIEGIELTSAAEALLSYLPSADSKEKLRQNASARAGVKAALCEFAWDLLVRSRVFVECGQSAVLSDLEAFFYLRDGSFDGVKRLKQSKVITYCFVEDGSALERAFQAAGLTPDLRPLELRTTLPKEDFVDCDVLACIGLPFHHPFARALNNSAVGWRTPVLFSEYGGGTARVGPTVLGGNLPCLDCVSTRHAANGGGALLEAVDETQAVIEAPPDRVLSHPTLRELLLHSSVLEVCRIVLREAPISFGGYLELSSSGETRRREALKVPRCVACSRALPERYPFDVTPLS